MATSYLKHFWLIALFVARISCQDKEASDDGLGHAYSDDTLGTESSGEHAELTDEQLHQVHSELDENKDKEASKHELANFVDKHKKDVALEDSPPEEEIERMDTSKDGKVSLNEYLSDVANETDAATGERDVEEFKAADANGDGVLDKDEMHALISPETHPGMVNISLKHDMRDADTDKDGKLSEDEFVSSSELALSAVEAFPSAENVQQASKQLFKKLDADGDGYIQLEELRPLMNGRVKSELVASNVITFLDKDGDQHIDSGELVQAKEGLKDNEIQGYLIAWAKKRQFLV